MTIQNAFESYVKQVYPNGISKTQEQELKRAFFAGGFFTMTFISMTTNAVPEDMAANIIESIAQEFISFNNSVRTNWLKTN